MITETIERHDTVTDGEVTQVRPLMGWNSLDLTKINSGVVYPSARPTFGSQVTTSFRSGGKLTFEEEAKIFTQVYQPARKALASTYDTGHEFNTVKTERIFTTSVRKLKVTNRYDEQFMLQGETGIAPILFGLTDVKSSLIPSMSPNDIGAYGAQAIGATIPTASKAGIAQMIGELKRDGLPSGLVANSWRNPGRRSLGSDYLNFEFGIKPLLSDIRKLLEAISHSSELLQQYQRDSGKIVRRGFTFPTERTTTTEIKPGSSPNGERGDNLVAFEGYDPTDSPITVMTRTTRDIYYRGAYSYYLDVGDTLISKMKGFEQRANYLLGLRLTPSVLWDLSPWSWFADWFGTFGLTLSNASAFQEDGLVIRYGYLMCHTVTYKTIQRDVRLYGQQQPFRVSTTYRSERKERYKATPYGFGLNVADFDLRKWAILGALGMTLAPGKMR